MTEQTPELNEPRDLIEVYSKFELPEAFKKSEVSPFGSKAFTKMMFFVAKMDVTNEDYDSIMSIKPPRQEYETKERYAKRTKLQKFLGKWKPYFYDYSVYDLRNNKQRRLDKAKAKIAKQEAKLAAKQAEVEPIVKEKKARKPRTPKKTEE